MIRVTFAPQGSGTFIFGKVEVDGVDISNRVQGLTFTRGQDGSNLLTLDLIIYGDDAVELDIPEEDLVVNVHVLRDGELIEATAVGDSARKYLTP